jgi:hypothetical protein
LGGQIAGLNCRDLTAKTFGLFETALNLSSPSPIHDSGDVYGHAAPLEIMGFLSSVMAWHRPDSLYQLKAQVLFQAIQILTKLPRNLVGRPCGMGKIR